jgi:ribosome maturation factor RimP
MMVLIRSGPFARSFLLGDPPTRSHVSRGEWPQPMSSRSSSADRRFATESGTERQIADLAEPVLGELGFRLVRVKVSGRDGGTVQVMADRPDGRMTIDDCATISRKLSPLLDALDPMPGGYRLEVSTPGIDRPLVRPSDFASWTGHEAKVELKELVSGRKRFRGRIEGVGEGEALLRIELAGEDEPQTIGIPFSLISEAKLVAGEDAVRADLTAKKAQ